MEQEMPGAGDRDVRQYCRYCIHMVCGDVNYCDMHKQGYSDAQIKRTNRCKDFELCTIDALGENPREYEPREYKPRARKEANESERGVQTSLFEAD